jgi:hypothetical protein
VDCTPEHLFHCPASQVQLIYFVVVEQQVYYESFWELVVSPVPQQRLLEKEVLLAEPELGPLVAELPLLPQEPLVVE